MKEYVDVVIQGAVIDAVVLIITGPAPDHMSDPSKKVDIPFLRIEDANNVPRWYVGIGTRDLESIIDEGQVGELENSYRVWLGGQKK